MYRFLFHYSDGIVLDCSDVVEVVYNSSTGQTRVEEAEISKHKFPLERDLTLYSSDGNYSVCGHNLRMIQVMKEN